jgi:HSP20 family protein
MPRTSTPQRRAIGYTPPASSPSRDLDAMRDRVQRFFEAPFGAMLREPIFSGMLAEPMGWSPAIEISESEGGYTVTAELPGMKRDDVHVGFERGVLTIEGSKEEERKEETEGRRVHIWERMYGSFERSFGFPGVDETKITADMKDGVLTVTLPKLAQETPRGRRISINEGK